MFTLDDLKKQNQEISELCEVLSVLVAHKSLHTNPYVCELMSRFKEKVWIHLVFEDNTIYSGLSEHSDAAIREVARNFHDSGREIKKRFSTYLRHWCKPVTEAIDHDALLEESEEIFRLIKQRIKYENEQIFPLIAAQQAA